MSRLFQTTQTPHVIVPLGTFRALLAKAGCHEIKSDLLEVEFQPEVQFSAGIKTLPKAATGQPQRSLFLYQNQNEAKQQPITDVAAVTNGGSLRERTAS